MASEQTANDSPDMSFAHSPIRPMGIRLSLVYYRLSKVVDNICAIKRQSFPYLK